MRWRFVYLFLFTSLLFTVVSAQVPEQRDLLTVLHRRVSLHLNSKFGVTLDKCEEIDVTEIKGALQDSIAKTLQDSELPADLGAVSSAVLLKWMQDTDASARWSVPHSADDGEPRTLASLADIVVDDLVKSFRMESADSTLSILHPNPRDDEWLPSTEPVPVRIDQYGFARFRLRVQNAKGTGIEFADDSAWQLVEGKAERLYVESVSLGAIDGVSVAELEVAVAAMPNSEFRITIDAAPPLSMKAGANRTTITASFKTQPAYSGNVIPIVSFETNDSSGIGQVDDVIVAGAEWAPEPGDEFKAWRETRLEWLDLPGLRKKKRAEVTLLLPSLKGGRLSLKDHPLLDSAVIQVGQGYQFTDWLSEDSDSRGSLLAIWQLARYRKATGFLAEVILNPSDLDWEGLKTSVVNACRPRLHPQRDVAGEQSSFSEETLALLQGLDVDENTMFDAAISEIAEKVGTHLSSSKARLSLPYVESGKADLTEFVSKVMAEALESFPQRESSLKEIRNLAQTNGEFRVFTDALRKELVMEFDVDRSSDVKAANWGCDTGDRDGQVSMDIAGECDLCLAMRGRIQFVWQINSLESKPEVRMLPSLATGGDNTTGLEVSADINLRGSGHGTIGPLGAKLKLPDGATLNWGALVDADRTIDELELRVTSGWQSDSAAISVQTEIETTEPALKATLFLQPEQTSFEDVNIRTSNGNNAPIESDVPNETMSVLLPKMASISEAGGGFLWLDIAEGTAPEVAAKIRQVSRVGSQVVPAILSNIGGFLDSATKARSSDGSESFLPLTGGHTFARAIALRQKFDEQLVNPAQDLNEFHLLIAKDEDEVPQSIKLFGRDGSGVEKDNSVLVRGILTELLEVVSSNGTLLSSSDRRREIESAVNKANEDLSLPDHLKIFAYGPRVAIGIRRATIRQFETPIAGSPTPVSQRPKLEDFRNLLPENSVLEFDFDKSPPALKIELRGLLQDFQVATPLGRVATDRGITEVQLAGGASITGQVRIPDIVLNWPIQSIGLGDGTGDMETVNLQAQLHELSDAWKEFVQLEDDDDESTLSGRFKQLGGDKRALISVTLDSGMEFKVNLLENETELDQVTLQSVYDQIQNAIDKHAKVGKNPERPKLYTIELFNFANQEVVTKNAGFIFYDPTFSTEAAKQRAVDETLRRREEAKNQGKVPSDIEDLAPESRFQLSVYRDDKGNIDQFGARLAGALGLLGTDTEANGTIKTAPLHGDSLSRHLIVTLPDKNVFAQAKLITEVVVDTRANPKGKSEAEKRSKATLNYGPIQVSILATEGDGVLAKGKGSLRATLEANLKNFDKPTASLFDLSRAPREVSTKFEKNAQIKLDAEASTSLIQNEKITASVTIGTVDSALALQVQDFQQPEFEKLRSLSLVGLNDNTKLRDLPDWEQEDNIGSLDAFSLAYKTSASNTLDYDRPAIPLTTIGDVRQWLEGGTQGEVTIEYSPDGTSLQLRRRSKVEGTSDGPATIPESIKPVFSALGFRCKEADELAALRSFLKGQSLRLQGAPIYSATLLSGLLKSTKYLQGLEERLENVTPQGLSLNLLEGGRLSPNVERFIADLRASRVRTFDQLQKWLKEHRQWSVLLDEAGKQSLLGLKLTDEELMFRFVWNRSEVHPFELRLGKANLGAFGEVEVDLRPVSASRDKLKARAMAQASLAFGIDLSPSDPSNQVFVLCSEKVDNGPSVNGDWLEIGNTFYTGLAAAFRVNEFNQADFQLVTNRFVAEINQVKFDTTKSNLDAYLELPDIDGPEGNQDRRVYGGILEVGGLPFEWPDQSIEFSVGEFSIPKIPNAKLQSFEWKWNGGPKPQLDIGDFLARLNLDLSGPNSIKVDIGSLGLNSDALFSQLRIELENKLKRLKLPVFGSKLNVSLDILSDLELAFGRLGNARFDPANGFADLETYLRDAFGQDLASINIPDMPNIPDGEFRQQIEVERKLG